MKTIRLDEYAPLVGAGEIAEIRALAACLGSVSLQHINSTSQGGGVAEILSWLVPLMQDVGIDARWTVIEGPTEFFEVTKAFHNALHGMSVEITPEMFALFREVGEQNLSKVDGQADFVVVHDPQPLGLIAAKRQGGATKWIWRCHIDLSEADLRVWGFLRTYVERFDAAVFHLPEYAKELPLDQFILPPAIDPLSEKNRELAPSEVQTVLERFGIDPEKPIVLQVSRFDRLKDPLGVLEAFRLVRRSHECQLILVGGSAADDPESAQVLAEVREKAEKLPDVHILDLPPTSHREVNAFQRAATVVVQKSIREGFGLVVTEAMWKGKPVVGSAVGGIRRQIIHGVTGFLVHTVEGTAFRIRQLLSHPELAAQMGWAAREYVRTNFLLTRYLKNWLLVLLTVKHPWRGSKQWSVFAA
jgi:trehalose synthase